MVSSAFRSALSVQQKQEYKLLQSDEERRDYVAKFVLDPQEFKGKGTNSIKTVNTRTDDSTSEWLMESELAEPKFLNNVALASKLCKSGELASRLILFCVPSVSA